MSVFNAEIRPERDTSCDGLRNKIEGYLLTNLRPMWAFINRVPWLNRLLNRFLVAIAVAKAPARPLRLSTMFEYPCWTSLTDRSWFSRYLPPRDMLHPSLESLRKLYVVRQDGPRVSKHSTLLFPSFAQWFTDGFLMTDNEDRRRTHTNHQIDLCQIYGPTDQVQKELRLLSEVPGSKGRLISEICDREEWPPRLFDAEGRRDTRFVHVPDPVKMPAALPLDRKTAIFAFGGERANATVFTAAINTLFLREHNRLCGIIESENPEFDDEQVFQTARNVSIVQLIKIVIEEYINHISPYWFKFLGDPTPCYHAIWNRENWIPVEFNLLYRWHSLIPENALWSGAKIAMSNTRFGNEPLLRDGLGAALNAASTSHVWAVGLFNTAPMLADVEIASLQQGRDNRLASYNDYREVMHFPRVTRFEQISGEPDVVQALKEIYGDVDRIEFFVGLFSEDAPPRSTIPPLIGRMVAVDAFSHALTNPLLSPHVFNENTFTRAGMASIAATSSLKDLAARNLPRNANEFRISMDHPQHASVA